MTEKEWNIYPKIEPSEDKEYFCTVEGFEGRKNYTEILDYKSKKDNLLDQEWNGKGFYRYDIEEGTFKIPSVIAWMELPEPYKKVIRRKR